MEELSWTNFIFELINFLVLIWILRHFFFNPVRNIITQRQKAMKDKLQKAESKFNEACQMRVNYERRLDDWEEEKGEKRKQFLEQLEDWKSKEHLKFKKEMEKEHQKMLARQQQDIAEKLRSNEKKALNQAARFATKFLKDFADDALERKIVEKLIQDLSKNARLENAHLSEFLQDEAKVTVQSAYKLTDEYKEKIVSALKSLCKKNIQVSFDREADLIAGLNIQLGTFVIKANLRDELNFFADIAHEP